MELIRLEGICKSYRRGNLEIPVLQGVSLTIQRGELIALVGLGKRDQRFQSVFGFFRAHLKPLSCPGFTRWSAGNKRIAAIRQGWCLSGLPADAVQLAIRVRPS